MSISPHATCWIYKVMICPIIAYANLVWWTKTAHYTFKTGKLQRFACLGIKEAMATKPTAALESLLDLLHSKILIEKAASVRAKSYLSLNRADARMMAGIITCHCQLNNHHTTVEVTQDPLLGRGRNSSSIDQDRPRYQVTWWTTSEQIIIIMLYSWLCHMTVAIYSVPKMNSAEMKQGAQSRGRLLKSAINSDWFRNYLFKTKEMLQFWLRRSKRVLINKCLKLESWKTLRHFRHFFCFTR